MPYTTGDIIKNHRIKKGFSQRELARLLNTTQQTIHKYENNIISVIPPAVLINLCQVLEIPPEHQYIIHFRQQQDFLKQLLENEKLLDFLLENKYLFIRKSDFTPAQLEQLQNFIAFLRSQHQQPTPQQ